MQIQSIEDIQSLILAGEHDWKKYGEVNVGYHEGLIIFNYSTAAQYSGRWNWFERHSRGLIFNAQTAEIVARSWPKFFNIGQAWPNPDTHIVEITEKVDGSLGILFRHEGRYRIATRGRLSGIQADWATAWLQQYLPLDIDDDYTLLFEIVYPCEESDTVVNYGDRHDLVLVGAVNRFTGEDLWRQDVEYIANHHGFSLPATYDFDNLQQIIDAARGLPVNQEGWVIRYSDNERFKVKGDQYLLASYVMEGIGFRRVLRAVIEGNLEQAIAEVPDEYLGRVRGYVQEIEDTVNAVLDQIEEAFAQAPQMGDMDEDAYSKVFAAWASRYNKTMRGYLFKRLKGHDLLSSIYRHAFVNRQSDK